MSRARLRLTGAISFTSQVLGYIIGILFTAMVSRRLSEREFGAWAYIGTLLSYAVTPTDLFATWIYRDAARGRKILGPAILLNAPILFTAILLYIALSNQAAASAGLQTGLVLLGLITMPPLYITTAITDVAKGYVPQHVGISSIIFETSKLALGILLVAQLRLGLQGAFTTLAIAYTLQLIYLLTRIKPLASRQIDLTTIKRWMRGSIFKLVSVVSGYVSQLDIILITTITTTTLITGYWQAALLIALMVKSTGSLMVGLTERLLAGGGQRDIDKSFTLTMTIAAPALLGATILGRDILYAFRPTYAAVWPVAIMLAASSFIAILTSFYSSTIFASDRLDLREDTSFKDFAQSLVFQLWKIELYTSIIYAMLIAAMLLYLKTLNIGILTMLSAVSVVHLMINTARLVIYRRLSERYAPYRPRLKAALPNMAASTIMAVVLLLARMRIDPQAPTIVEALQSLFYLTAIGALTYFAAIWLLSRDFRDLLNDTKTFLKSNIHT